MESVIIKVKTRNDSKFLEKLARKMGFEAITLSDFELRIQARKKIVEIAEKQQVLEFGDEKIQLIVEKVRLKSHGKN